MAVVRVARVQGEGPTSGPRPTLKRLILAVLDRFSCRNIHLFFALVIVTPVIGHTEYRFNFHAIRPPTLADRNFRLFLLLGFDNGYTSEIFIIYVEGAWEERRYLVL